MIEKHELQAALLASGQIEEDAHIKQTVRVRVRVRVRVTPPPSHYSYTPTPSRNPYQVDNMIEWACTKAP